MVTNTFIVNVCEEESLMKKSFTWLTCMLFLLTSLLTNVVGAKAAEVPQSSSKNVIAYFPNWGMYNDAHQRIKVSMLPWDKLTVINHAFFTVDSQFKLASTDTYADFDAMMDHSEGWDPGQMRGHFGEYKYYKNQYPNVKVLISIGGWTRGENFHAMALTQQSRAIFINSLINYLKQYPYIDGFDLDWEYPGVNRMSDPNDSFDRGCPGGPEDRVNFTLLLKEIREAYNANGMPEKMLTIAAPGGYDKADLIDPDKFHQYLDFINVMTYDMHGAWDTKTNHHAALYPNPADPSNTSPVNIKQMYNTSAALNVYKLKGVPANKLNAGTPFYSRGWRGVNAATGTNGLFADAAGAATGTWDNASSPGGQYPWFDLKKLETTAGWQKYRDSVAKVPYLYNRTQGIMLSYEDETSLTDRCDFIINNNYGGLIIWEISGDGVGFPMTTIASNKLKGVPNNPTDPVDNTIIVTPTVSANSTNNTGTYKLTLTVPQLSKANTLKLYENGQVINTYTINPENTAATVYNVDFTSKAKGTYKYKAEISNSVSLTTSAEITVAVTDSNTQPTPGYRVIGYVYENKPVDPAKLTHINVAFGLFNSSYDGTIYVQQPELLRNMVNLKQVKPSLKVLLSIGGWEADGFSQAAATTQGREKVASECLRLINEYGLDGVDLDWEYPVNGGWGVITASPADKTNFTLLLQAIRNKIGVNKILSIASGASSEYAQNTELSKIANICDYINIMTYDFGSSRHNANLYTSSPYGESISGDAAVRIHMNNGVPANKITLGVPFYGRMGANWPTYDELVNQYINKNGYTRVWDNTAKAAYLTQYGSFAGTYEDPESIGYKTDYIKQMGLGGGMFWHYHHDSSGTLLNKLYTGLNSTGPVDPTLAAPSLTVNNANNTGSYSLTVTVPANSGAASVKVYEGTALAREFTVNPTAATVSTFTVSYTGKAAGSYSYTAKTFSAAGTTASSPAVLVTVTTVPVGNIPAKPSVSHDNWDGDGNYKITMNMWWGENGTQWKLYENGTLISTQSLTANSPNSQSSTVSITGKANGTYRYRAELINSSGAASSDEIAVSVTSGSSNGDSNSTKPLAPAISVDSAQNYGTYNLTVNIPSNSKATNLKVYEGSVIIRDTTVNATSAATISIAMTGKTVGTYSYKAVLTNTAGSTESAVITVTVQSTDGGNNSAPLWTASTAYKVGDKVTYNGKVYQCLQSHTSLVGWEPANVAALWRLV
jgi:GH18 family chitinase